MRFLLAWIARLPLPVVHAAGTLLGWGAWLGSRRYRERMRNHGRQAGVAPELLRRSVAEAGRMSAEVPWLWFRPADRPLGDLVRWEGPPLVDEAVAAGRGLLMITPHMGCFEVAGRTYAERHGATRPITALYRPARQAWLARIQAESRQRPGMQVAPASLAGVRMMLRALKKGDTVGLLPDQVPPAGQGAWAPYFGRPAYTMTLAARLVRQTGAMPVLVWAERLPRGRGYILHQRPFPQVERLHADISDEDAATLMNQAMESLVRESPSQYIWAYRRYKKPRPADAEAGAAADRAAP
jgi:Kdo2-lipid IVA lauroyltransferase/acyltransferase